MRSFKYTNAAELLRKTPAVYISVTWRGKTEGCTMLIGCVIRAAQRVTCPVVSVAFLFIGHLKGGLSAPTNLSI